MCRVKQTSILLVLGQRFCFKFLTGWADFLKGGFDEQEEKED